MRPVLVLMVIAAPALGQSADPGAIRAEILLRLDASIDLAELDEKATFDEARQFIEKRLGGKVAIRLDERAFRGSMDAIRSTPVHLPPRKLPAALALRIALDKVHERVKNLPAIELLPQLPDTLLVTSAELSMVTESYDLRPVLREADGWLDAVRQTLTPGSGRRREEIDADSPAEILTGLLAGHLSAEAVCRLENDEKLIVRTTPSGHRAIVSQIAALERLADVRVRMKASLYEIDAPDFEKHVAPLIAAAEKNGEPRSVFPIGRALAQTLASESPILIGPAPRLRNGFSGMFLSRKWVRRTAVPRTLPGFGGPNLDDKVLVTHLVGQTLSAKVTVSPDRRSVVMDLTQTTAVLDLKREARAQRNLDGDGKQVEVIVPEPRTRSSSETVRVDDGDVLLVVVQPPLREAEGGARWIVLVEPQISIHAEEQLLSVMPQRVR